MFIVKIMGGLGNQMFQYAFYKTLQETGQNVKVDIIEYKKYKQHNGFELETIFNITCDKCSDIQRIQIADKNQQKNRFHRRLNSIYQLFKEKNTVYAEIKPITYEKEVFSLNGDKYFIGYWQTEKYFENIKEQLILDFKFKPLDENNAEIAKLIESCQSVSIHVHRGDYVGNPFHDVCGEDYYLKAVSIMAEKIKNPIFFVFSDDISYCKNMFKDNNFNFIEHNKSCNSYKDMQLMSLCKHNIIANSSFSWWGAWLNRNSQKIVIAPQKWLGKYDYEIDIIPDSWQKI